MTLKVRQRRGRRGVESPEGLRLEAVKVFLQVLLGCQVGSHCGAGGRSEQDWSKGGVRLRGEIVAVCSSIFQGA